MAAPTQNNVQTLQGDGASSYTLANYVVGSESDRILVVRVSYRNVAVDLTGITFGGVALAEAIGNTGARKRTTVWQLVNPAASTGDIVVTLSGNDGVAVVASYLSGARQTDAPDATGIADSGGTAVASINCAVTTLTADTMILTGFIVWEVSTITLSGDVDATDFTNSSGTDHGSAFGSFTAGGVATYTATGAVSPDARMRCTGAAYAGVAGGGLPAGSLALMGVGV